MSSTQAQALRVERTIKASPERVFDAWLDPELLRRWWKASPRHEVVSIEVDASVGGGYRLAMRNGSGEDGLHTVRGSYLAIERPRRLVYTWAWEDADGGLGPQSTVNVEFRPEGSDTHVLILHEGLGSTEAAARHEEGWNGVLDSFAQGVESS